MSLQPTLRPGLIRSFAAMLRDAWREFLDAKILYILLAAIGLIFGVALTGHIEPMVGGTELPDKKKQPGGRQYLDICAKSLAVNLDGVDFSKENISDIAGRATGSLYSIAKAESTDGKDLPTTSWKVALNRNSLPLLGKAESPDQIRARFGKIADGQLWQVTDIRESTPPLSKALGQQSWELQVEPGPDLRMIWFNRFTLFADSLEMTPPMGAPLGLEVLILQKLLTTGLGGSILLLISVVVTAAFVPNMVRKGTLELLLVRPIPRWRLLVFKYVGSLLFVGALLGLLIFFAWLVTGILANIWSPGIILALPSLLLFFALLLSVSTFTGVLTRSTLSAMLVTVCYWVVLFILGQMHAQTVDSRIRFENAGKPQKLSIAQTLRGAKASRQPQPDPNRLPFFQTTVGRVAETVYSILPHTEDLDTMVDRQLMRDFSVAGPMRALVESAEFSWAKGLGLTLAHTGVFLLLACLIFSKRDP